MKRILSKLLTNEKGQALPIVLLLLLLGGLVIAPLLGFMSTGIEAGRRLENKMYGFYAADAGVEDALWRTKNEAVPLDSYDYDTDWIYDLPEAINGNDVNVTIKQVWPLDGLETADESDKVPHEELLVVGFVTDTENGEYQVEITYDGSVGDLPIERVGVWLPPGFEYVYGSSDGITENDPTSTDTRGGKALIWDFGWVNFKDLPHPEEEEEEEEEEEGFTPATEYPMKRILTFNFSPAGQLKGSVSWVITGHGDIPLSWDTGLEIYYISATATDTDGKTTTVETYTSKEQLEKAAVLMHGDYRAIGNTLMVDTNGDAHGIRDELLTESSATISDTDIPDDADVVWAYLYWSAWLAGADEQILFEDDCSDMSSWIPGADWQLYQGRFRGHQQGGGDKYLNMVGSLDLSSAPSDSTKVSWEQDESGWLESGDCLKFQFSANGGITWGDPLTAFCNDNPPSSFSYTIPDEYLTEDFKMRFYLGDFGGWGEYVYIDNIGITATLATTADTSVSFKVNDQQVYFDELGQPTEGEQDITASRWWLLENKPDTYSYSCFKDVTKLVKLISPRGNGEYTIGGVDGDTGDHWSYAGWSLVIVYSSPSEKAHNLYIYDDFLYADEYSSHTFTIEGFHAPEDAEAKLTCFVGEGDECYGDYQHGWDDIDWVKFNDTDLPDSADGGYYNVWNGKFIGLGEVEEVDGVDIDTFDVSSPIIEPGDTEAEVELGTGLDSWNLVYIILSFRSDVPGVGLKPNTVGSITYTFGG